MDPDGEKAYAEKPSADARQGTEPEGTRWALIRHALRGALREEWAPDVEPGVVKVVSRRLADAVESALRGHPPEGKVPVGTDEWIAEVAFQAAGAATRPLLEDHPDYVFPSERVRDAVTELLEDFGVEPRVAGERTPLTNPELDAVERGRDAADPTLSNQEPKGSTGLLIKARSLLNERLEEGTISPTDCARVIDILAHGTGSWGRLEQLHEGLAGIEDRLCEIRDGVRG